MVSWASLVNQKLFFSNMLLEQLDKLDDPFGHLEKALCESAVYQLECGYRHHLREIADNYRSPQAESVKTVSELIAQLEAMGKHPAEAQEMAYLEADSENWLSQLLACWRAFSEAPLVDAEPDRASPIPLMQVSQTNTLPPLNAVQVSAWIDAMRELVERHRQVMVEW